MTKRRLRLGRPALCLAHHEVAEYLYPRHRLQLFRIDEIGVDLDRVGFTEQLHQAVVFLDEVIRECCDTEALLTGPDKSENVVDLEECLARTRAVTAGVD